MARLLRALLVMLMVLALLLVAAALYLRTGLPKIRGRLTLDGLSDQVEVVRDRYGIPHIFAGSPQDALFALGFVHAQDRLWQMEFQRRVGAGRLAEVVGEAALPTDKFLRTLSVYHYAEATIPKLEPWVRELLEAYVAGINAYLEVRRGPLPPEFLILGFQPKPWSVADVLVWVKMMAWDLGGNWRDELLRARLTDTLSLKQIEELWPPYPGDAPVVLPDFTGLYRALPLDELWAASPAPLPAASGSNNWVLDGTRTASGKPLLANDPHLALGTPSPWYLVHLSAPGLEVIGASLPGTPAVLLGRSDRLAWGFTNTDPDVQDLFIERLDPDDPDRYQTPDGFEPFVIRSEVIRVKGGQDVTLRVRESRHGPILSDVSRGAAEVAEAAGGSGGFVLALQWTALRDDDLTLQAIMKMNRASSWRQFTEALRDFHSAQQNIVYADVEGNIGYYAPGRVPIRASGEGRMPVPGWSGEFDWQGFIPFEELPHAFNPASGEIVTANNKVVPDDYPYFITADWAEPYRVERIGDLLQDLDRHTAESFARIQADQLSLMSTQFLPLLLSLDANTAQEREAQAELLAWDGTMDRALAAPLIFSAWYRAFAKLVYSDELGDRFEDYYGLRPLFLQSVITRRTEWCDDVRTEPREDCRLQASRALKQALAFLNESFGGTVKRWSWGRAHRAYHPHAIFTGTPLGRLFDLSVANGGDAFTVDAARFDIADEGEPFRQVSGPSYRAIYDLADLDNSRFIQATGQSGNPLSRHYRDLLVPWRDVEYLPMTTDPEAVRRAARAVLRLEPK